MRHRVDQRKLSRNSTQRNAMFASMATSLIEHERIETTLPRAKELRRVAEKLITKGKKGGLHQRRQVAGFIRSAGAVKKVFEDLAPRFADRQGGYTRILRKAGRRFGDAAEMAVIEFVDYELPPLEDDSDKKEAKKKKKEEKELEKQALAASKDNKKDTKAAAAEGPAAKPSTAAAGGKQKSTTVRKTSKG